MDNRRQFARVDYEILASYNHREGQQVADEGMAKTLNLSVGGLLLQLPREAETGSLLDLALNLDGQVVEVVGRVVRCGTDENKPSMFSVGVELVSVPAEFVSTLESFFSS